MEITPDQESESEIQIDERDAGQPGPGMRTLVGYFLDVYVHSKYRLVFCKE